MNPLGSGLGIASSARRLWHGCLQWGSVRCRVVAWEPVPQFRLFLEYGLQLNGFLGAVEVRRSAVADVDGGLYTLQVPRVWARVLLTCFTSCICWSLLLLGAQDPWLSQPAGAASGHLGNGFHWGRQH